ncbi:MAG: hypothetical protein BGO01_00355 [Armatimonadetes bacterium 55-13]|nr:hypothetical protein [Armatimonadota bacterium]OJU63151.1 MAG: hypothetical protein BGO01_00355 [Armatimonadetes bacterium 55-13]
MKRLSRTIFWGVTLAVTVAATLVNWPAIDKLPGKTSLDEFIRIPNETVSGAMRYFPALAKAYREGHQEVQKQVQELLRQGKVKAAKRKADQEMGESLRLR